MLPRPEPHPIFPAIRLTLTVLIAVHVFISAWLVATVDASYTEGPPAPTTVHSLVAIDKDQTLIDVEINRATSLVLYTLSRDSSATVDNSTTSEQGIDGAGNASTVNWLAIGRMAVGASLLVLVLVEALSWVKPSAGRWLRVTAFALALSTIFVLFPASYVYELSSGMGAANNSPGFDLDNSAFAHSHSDAELHLVWIGLELTSDFSGYDLGLVDPANRSNVRATVPTEGTDDASSFVAFESTFAIQYGKNLDALFLVPMLWWLLPGVVKTPTSEEE